jgi:hypothetical protein
VNGYSPISRTAAQTQEEASESNVVNLKKGLTKTSAELRADFHAAKYDSTSFRLPPPPVRAAVAFPVPVSKRTFCVEQHRTVKRRNALPKHFLAKSQTPQSGNPKQSSS